MYHITPDSSHISFANKKLAEIERNEDILAGRPVVYTDIDTVMCNDLKGRTMKEALNFIDDIRSNKMKIKWLSDNVWSVQYKRKHIFDIKIEDGTWSVARICEKMNSQESFIRYCSENMKWLVGNVKNAIKGPQRSYQAS